MRSGIRPASLLIAAILLIAVILGAACSLTTTTTGTSATHLVPRGWKTYTYGRARISVPNDWAVVTNYNCPGSHPLGVLYLGPPQDPSASCPFSGSQNSVTVTSIASGATYQSPLCSQIRVNGVRVFVGPCGSSNPGGLVIYWVPALGVEAIGMGIISENVTGPGTGTIVGQVLHTLRANGS
jgi:hypothetical protein